MLQNAGIGRLPLLLFTVCALGATVPIGALGLQERLVTADNASGAVFLARKDEQVELRVVRARLEAVASQIAEKTGMALHFFCRDPGLEDERISLRLSGESLMDLVEELLAPAYETSFFDAQGAPLADPEAQPALAQAHPQDCTMRDHPVRVVRPYRSHPLFSSGTPPEGLALDALERALGREGPMVRRAMLVVLRVNPDPRAMILARRALADRDPSVVLAAAETVATLTRRTLTQVEAQSAGTATPDRTSADALVQALATIDRERLWSVLGDLTRELAGTALAQALERMPLQDLVIILAQLDPAQAWPAIETLTRAGDEPSRAVAVRALVLTRDRRGIPFLAQTVASASPETAQQAAMATATIGGPEAAAALRELLANEEPARQAMAALAIRSLTTADGAQARQELDQVLRRAEVSDELLETLVAARYVEPLRRLMAEPSVDTDIKVRLARAAAAHRREGSIPFLAVGLEQADTEVRLESVKSLASLKTTAAVQYLLRATRDIDPEVRGEAVRGLAGVHPTDLVIVGLKNALRDGDEGVRREAIDVFFHYGYPSDYAIAVLESAAASEDPYVAEKAEAVLRHHSLR